MHIILGPTSSGKTSLAVKLCKQLGGEIISADSRQIYKCMDIGTGKVPIKGDFPVQKFVDYWTLDDVVIWGYDLASPDDYFSAYDYALWALSKARGLLEEGKQVFLVGGTGLFVDFFIGLVKPADVPPDFKLRKELEPLTLEQLQKKLMSLNPDTFEKVDQKNPARLIRAIEIKTSKLPSPTPLPYLENVEFRFVGLTGSREFLYARADNWLDFVWENGLIGETQSLISKGFGGTKPLNGLVYKSVRAFLDNALSEEDAKQQAKNDLHAYIRRQQTYFKKNKDIKWFNIEDSTFAEQTVDHVQSK